ncbi:MAG: thiosulfate/3-mercaptopyruvate sulfurtransferase [Oceanospirillaceae bacterium]|jgi:thiosulfate/3-mercaptopyruvate sulfurtransferase
MFSTLITAQQLAHNYHSDHWVILDCRFDLMDTNKGQLAYQQGHIEGAQYIDLNKQLSGVINAHSGRHPLPEIADITHLLSQCGVGAHTQVVVYDDCSGAMSARAWWLLQWLGHENVAVLDGGIDAWLDASLALTKTVPVIENAHFVRRSSLYQAVTTDQICSGDYQLIDARAAARFNGEVEPIDPIAGHIPSALNRPFTQNLTSNKCFKPALELQEIWSPLAQDNSVHMCGSGVTACHNLLAMRHAGLAVTKLYVGSWSEWIKDSARAVG